MRIEIDISGQIQQLNYDSALGFWRDNGIEKSVYLKSETKKEIIKRYKGQVTSLIEKLHCILIYYCIRDYLDNVNEIKICRDINVRRLKNFLPLLFKNHNYLEYVKIAIRSSDEPESKAHRIALKTFRRRKFAILLITREMIENVLFEFKK
ncbi:hypothetical protein HYX03_02000 [Candidatus Woesearchaeota archaeon]|nr:hypothetical protein [Candidatus Woesearchaeota archaeon]